ncbi:site-specific integrase [Oceanobacillus kimchii]|uniref:tyrosine-type recombinase/integrase n=1 Tax=Oceanobacillus kimchii TaxID=746691 RepID=UPI0021A67C7E|nr:site-specific integrase [Oceanobacillus kimchii]MCT1577571.1 site-specific integrase [Oceanobacillus kimchii]MCT2136559.1 site-specific integrase [Oceanobacillus kimchii]
MPTYQKRGKTYQYTISRYINGKYDPIRKGGFKKKSDAIAEAADIEARLKKGQTIHTKLEPVNEYFKNWVTLYKSEVSPGTKSLYNYSYEFINQHFGDMPLQHIRASDYQRFMNTLGKKYSKESVKKVNSHMRACVLDAIDDGVIHADFTRKAVLTGKDSKPEGEKIISYKDASKLKKEIIRCLQEEDRPVYYMILLALTSGMRYAEMIGLTRNDFNFTTNTITVNKTRGYLTYDGEGEKKTKNKTSNRIIDMDDETMKIFNSYFERTPNNILKLVFYNPASKYKIYSNTGVRKALRKLLISLDIDSSISIHGLRHTHASILLYKDVSVDYVSQRLGHADIDTTLKVYSHLINERRIKDIRKTKKVLEAM